jgi:hypothetical protein
MSDPHQTPAKARYSHHTAEPASRRARRVSGLSVLGNANEKRANKLLKTAIPPYDQPLAENLSRGRFGLEKIPEIRQTNYWKRKNVSGSSDLEERRSGGIGGRLGVRHKRWINP